MEIQSLNKKNRLGRGLDSLLGPSLQSELKIFSLDIDKILPNKNQPRKHFEKNELESLALSIKNHGILQPILVQRKGDSYQIIAGERRWRAAAQAGIHKVPAIVKNPNSKQASLWALLENLQRKDLNPLEEARAYQVLLKEQGLNQEELAKTLGISRSSLTNSLRLFQLDPKVQKYLEKGQISFSQAKEILSCKNPKEQRELAEKCVKGKMTVRSLAKSKKSGASKKKSLSSWMTQSCSRLERIFYQKVNIQISSKKKGQLSFAFNSEEELKSLLEKLWTIKK